MAYTDQYTLSNDGAFKGRVGIAMVTAALAVVGEDQGTMENRDWAKRHRLGVQVLRSPADWIEQFALAVAANATITAGSTDSDIQFTVNAAFGDVAGVGQHSHL